MKFNLKRADLIIEGTHGCGENHPDKGWEKLQLALLVTESKDLKNGPTIITVSKVNFIIDDSLPAGAWFDKKANKIAFKSENSKLWHFTCWNIYTDQIPAELKKAVA